MEKKEIWRKNESMIAGLKLIQGKVQRTDWCPYLRKKEAFGGLDKSKL